MKTLNEFIIMLIVALAMICIELLLFGHYNDNENLIVLSGISGGLCLFIVLMRLIFNCVFKTSAFTSILLLLITIGFTSCEDNTEIGRSYKIKVINAEVNNIIFRELSNKYKPDDTVYLGDQLYGVIIDSLN